MRKPHPEQAAASTLAIRDPRRRTGVSDTVTGRQRAANLIRRQSNRSVLFRIFLVQCVFSGEKRPKSVEAETI